VLRIFHPYPGTESYQHCLDNHYILDENAESYFQPISSLETPSLAKGQAEYYFRIFRVAVQFPALLPVASLMAKIKVARHTTIYDASFSIVFSVFEFLRKRLPARLKNPLFRILKI
jgi:hypothetical protein